MIRLQQRVVQVDDDTGYLISDSRHNLLYFPLRSLIFEVSGYASDAHDGDVFSTSVKKLLSEKLLESPLRTLPKAGSRRANNVLGIALSDSCNLACVYCHASAGKMSQLINDTLADDAIEHVVKDSVAEQKGMLLVIIGSGEPTATWKKLVRVVELAKTRCADHGVGFQAIMSTNGVFGAIKRKYISENFSQISLSLDGPPDIHNENRPTCGGGVSFDAAFATAKYFYRKNVPFGIRATVSSKQASRLLEIYEFFREHFPETHIAFEPIIPMGRGLDHLDAVQDMSEFVMGFTEIIRKYGKAGFSYSGISFGKIKNQFCGPVSGAQFNLSMDGTLRGCSRLGSSYDFIYGRYLPSVRKFEINQDKRDSISRISVEDFEECEDCFARYNCAGDCPDMRSRSSLRCDANRAILWNYLLKEVLHHENL